MKYVFFFAIVCHRGIFILLLVPSSLPSEVLQMPLRPSQLALRPSQLLLRPSQLSPRPFMLSLKPYQMLQRLS